MRKIVGKMSLRTLACVSLGFGSAVGAAAFVHLGLHADVADAAFPIMLCSMPFWLAGFWRPFGMRAEELLPLLAAHELSPQLLAYEPCLVGSLPEDSPRPEMTTLPALPRVRLCPGVSTVSRPSPEAVTQTTPLAQVTRQ